MDLFSFIQIIIKNLKYLIITPVIFGGLTLFLTKDQPVTYNVKASVFTGMTTGSSITNIDNDKVDMAGAQAQYNNMMSVLKSRSVKEETSLRLLALFLSLDKPTPNIISTESYEQLMSITPDEVKSLAVTLDPERTFQRLNEYKTEERDNFLYGLLNFNHAYFSYRALSKINISKDGGDIVKFSYDGNDPGIIYQTVKITIDVFMERYHDLKEAQTEAVVKYFEDKLNQSARDLAKSEDELLEFNKSNNIINYYEQTRYVSSQQEKLELSMQDIILEFEAASAVLAKLESETQSRYQINLKNTEIMDLRSSLIAVNQEIAQTELDENLIITSAEQRQLIREKEALEKRLSEKIDSLYIFERNTDGIALESLLTDWLRTVIEYESARSRLDAMRRKIDEFKQIYTQYAPLGAILKRIEREIDVKEREYLNLLHHLGLAKLKQQNDTMTSNMEILDPPQFPIDATPGKRKIFVAIASLFSIIFLLVGILLFELLDKTIKTTGRLYKFTGIEPIGALIEKSKTKGDYFRQINAMSLKPLIEIMAHKWQNTHANQKIVVQVFSIWEREGKSFVIEHLKEFLDQIGITAISVGFNEQLTQSTNNDSLTVKESFNFKNFQEILQSIQESKANVVIMEIPALATTTFNTNLFASAHLSIMVTDMCRTWSNADDYHIDKFKSLETPELFSLANKILPGAMEQILGDLPKHRSKFRVFLKNRIFKRFLFVK